MTAPRAAPIGPARPRTCSRRRPAAAGARQAAAPAAPTTRVVPHAHPWGAGRDLDAPASSGSRRRTAPTIVPPSRALWIPPGVEHAVTVVEDADLLTLYLDHRPAASRAWPRTPPRRRAGGNAGCSRSRACCSRWRSQLDARPDDASNAAVRARRWRARRRIAALLLDELRRAPPVRARHRPAAARSGCGALCEAMLDDPSRHASLEAWAGDAGASARTDRAALPQRARHVLRPLAPAGAARPRGAAGGARACRWRRSPPSSATPARAPSPPWSSARSAARRCASSAPRPEPVGAAIRAGRARRPTIHADAATARPRHRAIRRLALASAGTRAEDRGIDHSSARHERTPPPPRSPASPPCRCRRSPPPARRAAPAG